MHDFAHRVNRWLLLLAFIVPALIFAAGEAACLAGDQGPDDAEKILRVVLVPEKNTFEQLRLYKYITNYLSEKMGMGVSLEMMANYGEICDAFKEGRADAGFFGSFSYVLTQAQTDIELLARPVWLDGSSSYRGYIFVRKDSRIESVKDMKNKSLVLVDRATYAGFIYPLYYLKYFGIDNFEDYFSRISYASSHDAAIWAVYTGEADVGGAKDHIFNDFREKYPDFNEKMLIIAESPEVPSNGFAVRKNLNPATKLLLKTLLFSMDDSPEGRQILENFGARRFVKTIDDDYDPLYNMIDSLGITLENYLYK